MIFPRSQRCSEFPKSPRARVWGFEKPRGAQRSARGCGEVRTNWRSGAVLNRREKREKAGAIEGEKEGARYGSAERFWSYFSRPFVFKK